MNYNKEKKQAVKDYLMSLKDAIILPIYNEYADDAGDDTIFDNDEDTINELFDNPYEAIRAAYYGEYNFTDDYVSIDSNGNLQSSDNLCDLIDFDYLTDWVIENDPREIRTDLENELPNAFSEAFRSEHPDADIEDYLDDYDFIGEDWNDIAIEIEKKMNGDKDDE